MKDGPKVVLYIIGFLILFAGLGFYFTGLDFGLTAYFSPKYTQVQRNVYEQSQAFNDGAINNLYDLMNQYNTEKDPTAKAGIAATFRQRVQEYPNQLPPALESFKDSLGQ
jgi:hypothetical protein